MNRVITIKGGKIVGIRTSIFTIFNQEKYDPRAIPGAWQSFFEKAAQLNLGDIHTFYGASIPSMSLDTPMDYFAGALVESKLSIPENFESVEIPTGNYLEVIHRGPITSLAASYQKAYMEALGASGKTMRPAPHLEIYNSQLNPMADDYEMVIAVPVED